MDTKIYLLVYSFVQSHKSLHKSIIFINSISPKVMMVLFYGLMPILAIMRDLRIIPFAAFPLAELLIVTKFRDAVDRPRPFDVLDVMPLEKHSSGHSFPSLHCSSSFSITTALYYINPILGTIGLAVSILVAVSRLLAGVHYPSDILAGTAIGLLFGIPYIFL
ncbi:undecaprenyl-diphosphatase BcrC [Clostridiales bacterium]|nr:undecaprenyl-diphosphatase BcrC [Clostridiales bacterium]